MIAELALSIIFFIIAITFAMLAAAMGNFIPLIPSIIFLYVAQHYFRYWLSTRRN